VSPDPDRGQIALVAPFVREAIRTVAKGELLLPSAIALKFAESMAHPELTERERQVLKYIAEGGTNKQIWASTG
jgi:DNA-binding NarL/FixJ family response regulator